MTKEQAIEKLKYLATRVDIEAAHMEADDVICELLNELGYREVTLAYAQVEKWYA